MINFFENSSYSFNGGAVRIDIFASHVYVYCKNAKPPFRVIPSHSFEQIEIGENELGIVCSKTTNKKHYIFRCVWKNEEADPEKVISLESKFTTQEEFDED